MSTNEVYLVPVGGPDQLSELLARGQVVHQRELVPFFRSLPPAIGITFAKMLVSFYVALEMERTDCVCCGSTFPQPTGPESMIFLEDLPAIGGLCPSCDHARYNRRPQ